jgi:hypothetical protein
VGDPAARAKSIEARAYATAQVASTTTSGARPHVEGVRIYTREAAKLLQALLAEAGAAGTAPAEAPAGDAEVRRRGMAGRAAGVCGAAAVWGVGRCGRAARGGAAPPRAPWRGTGAARADRRRGSGTRALALAPCPLSHAPPPRAR